jgi:hypothetical protein
VPDQIGAFRCIGLDANTPEDIENLKNTAEENGIDPIFLSLGPIPNF